MSSSRLPGKVLMRVDESKTVIEYVVEQLKHSKLIDKIIIVTSDSPEDDKIFHTITEIGVECFRGRESQVQPILIQGEDNYVKTKERWNVFEKIF